MAIVPWRKENNSQSRLYREGRRKQIFTLTNFVMYIEISAGVKYEQFPRLPLGNDQALVFNQLLSTRLHHRMHPHNL